MVELSSAFAGIFGQAFAGIFVHVSAKQLLAFFLHVSAEHLLASAGVIFATSCRYADMLLRICGHFLDLSARHVLTFMQTRMQRCM